MLACYHSAMTIFGFIVVAILIVLLIWLSIIDIRERRLPNRLVLAVAMLGLVLTVVQCIYISSWLPLKSSFVGMFLTAAPALLFSPLYYFVRKQEGFGAGDIKLLAALGLHLGAIGILLLPLASLLAALVTLPQLLFNKEKARKHTLAFGPYISVAAILLLTFIMLY